MQLQLYALLVLYDYDCYSNEIQLCVFLYIHKCSATADMYIVVFTSHMTFILPILQ
jgi:hypothetical protein